MKGSKIIGYFFFFYILHRLLFGDPDKNVKPVEYIDINDGGDKQLDEHFKKSQNVLRTGENEYTIILNDISPEIYVKKILKGKSGDPTKKEVDFLIGEDFILFKKATTNLKGLEFRIQEYGANQGLDTIEIYKLDSQGRNIENLIYEYKAKEGERSKEVTIPVDEFKEDLYIRVKAMDIGGNKVIKNYLFEYEKPEAKPTPKPIPKGLPLLKKAEIKIDEIYGLNILIYFNETDRTINELYLYLLNKNDPSSKVESKLEQKFFSESIIYNLWPIQGVYNTNHIKDGIYECGIKIIDNNKKEEIIPLTTINIKSVK